MIHRLTFAFLCCWATLCWSSEVVRPFVRPFVVGSMGNILARYDDQALIVSFWSIGCTHCPAELKTLGDMKKRYPTLNVVLVATDTPDEAAEAAKLASSYGLSNVEQWMFADAMPERLRAEIDKRWYGELPRTYLYDRHHKVESVSGLIPTSRLLQWVQNNAH